MNSAKLQSLQNLANLGVGFQGTGIQYLLKDEFTTDRAAGAVNGTSAEPTGGARTVTDTNLKISITGGKLSFATGEAANDGVWYPTHARVAGRMLMGLLNLSASDGANLAWDTNNLGSLVDGFRLATSNVLQVLRNASSLSIGTFTNATDYSVCIILKAAGAYCFIKGGTEFPNWTLAWVDTVTNNTPMYPAVNTNTTTAVFTADNIRIPTNLFLPTPLAYDTFTRANGALGSTQTTGPDAQTVTARAWTGSTFAISGNAAVNTPVTLGAELLTDPGLENWATATDLTSWTEVLNGTSTVNQETSIVQSGSNAVRLDVDASNSLVSVSQSIVVPAGAWLKMSVWMRSSASGKTGAITTNMHSNGVNLDPGTTYTQYVNTDRVLIANPGTVGVKRSGASSSSLYFDNMTIKILTPSELFSSISTSTKDVIADVNITQAGVKGIQAGVVVNLDSASNPQNFVIAYIDGYGSAILSKCVAGVYTDVISATVTYVAGATLRVIKDGTSYQLFYNNAKVGATSTISDASIINGTLHGLFSTHEGNSLDNFSLFPRGTDGNYEALNTY